MNAPHEAPAAVARDIVREDFPRVAPDQPLTEALAAKRIGGAFLDVTEGRAA